MRARRHGPGTVSLFDADMTGRVYQIKGASYMRIPASTKLPPDSNTAA